MPKSEKLSLFAASLININIMVGSGLFINTVLLAQNTGPTSPFVYALVGLLIFPLIASFSQLLEYHPGGNFYDFAKEINHFLGFLALWSYFNTKMAAATFGIHVFVSLMQTIFPLLQQFNVITLDLITITIFVCLNMLNMKIGKKIQYSFIIFKLIPILFAIIGGIILFNAKNLVSTTSYTSIITSLPFALFALTGFEAICSLSSKLENPKKDGPLVVFISFFCAIGIIFIYQLMFCAGLGSELAGLSSYLQAFPTLIKKLIPNGQLHEILQTILHVGIGASALGVAYGIMFSNSWNLHDLAKRNLVFGSDTFIKLNKHKVPSKAILAEGALAYTYILFTRGYQVPFQQITVIGLTVTYLLSCLGLLAITRKKSNKINITALFGLISCLILILSQVKNLHDFGIKHSLIYFFIMAIGSVMYFFKRNQLTNFESQES